MSTINKITGWSSFLFAVVFRPTWELFTTSFLFLFLATTTWIRDNFASDEWKRKLELRGFLPHIHPAWWLCIGLFVLLLLTVRESHKLWRDQLTENVELRKAEELRRFQPLPSTAPQVRLTSEAVPEESVTRCFHLRNVSIDQAIYNIVFQPVRLAKGVRVIWVPQSLDILEPATWTAIEPSVLVVASGEEAGEVLQYRGVYSLHSLLRSIEVRPSYNIGPVAFSCEDSAQNRYLVSFSVTLNSEGDAMQVTDLERLRIGSRPGEQ